MNLGKRKKLVWPPSDLASIQDCCGGSTNLLWPTEFELVFYLFIAKLTSLVCVCVCVRHFHNPCGNSIEITTVPFTASGAADELLCPLIAFGSII